LARWTPAEVIFEQIAPATPKSSSTTWPERSGLHGRHPKELWHRSTQRGTSVRWSRLPARALEETGIGLAAVDRSWFLAAKPPNSPERQGIFKFSKGLFFLGSRLDSTPRGQLAAHFGPRPAILQGGVGTGRSFDHPACPQCSESACLLVQGCRKG
jgi:hypothetical protein